MKATHFVSVFKEWQAYVIIAEELVCNVGCALSSKVNIACGFDNAKKA